MSYLVKEELIEDFEFDSTISLSIVGKIITSFVLALILQNPFLLIFPLFFLNSIFNHG
jgi:hypothetical protein